DDRGADDRQDDQRPAGADVDDDVAEQRPGLARGRDGHALAANGAQLERGADRARVLLLPQSSLVRGDEPRHEELVPESGWHHPPKLSRTDPGIERPVQDPPRPAVVPAVPEGRGRRRQIVAMLLRVQPGRVEPPSPVVETAVVLVDDALVGALHIALGRRLVTAA